MCPARGEHVLGSLRPQLWGIQGLCQSKQAFRWTKVFHEHNFRGRNFHLFVFLYVSNEIISYITNMIIEVSEFSLNLKADETMFLTPSSILYI